MTTVLLLRIRIFSKFLGLKMQKKRKTRNRRKLERDYSSLIKLRIMSRLPAHGFTRRQTAVRKQLKIKN